MLTACLPPRCLQAVHWAQYPWLDTWQGGLGLVAAFYATTAVLMRFTNSGTHGHAIRQAVLVGRGTRNNAALRSRTLEQAQAAAAKQGIQQGVAAPGSRLGQYRVTLAPLQSAEVLNAAKQAKVKASEQAGAKVKAAAAKAAGAKAADREAAREAAAAARAAEEIAAAETVAKLKAAEQVGASEAVEAALRSSASAKVAKAAEVVHRGAASEAAEVARNAAAAEPPTSAKGEEDANYPHGLIDHEEAERTVGAAARAAKEEFEASFGGEIVEPRDADEVLFEAKQVRELQRKGTKSKSYYVTIDGVKFDRLLLDSAKQVRTMLLLLLLY